MRRSSTALVAALSALASVPLLFTSPAQAKVPAGFEWVAGGYIGDGATIGAARFRQMQAADLDDHGRLVVADTYNHRVRRVELPAGPVTTILGSGAESARLSSDPGATDLDGPQGVSVAPDGSLLVSDTGNGRVLRVSPSGDHVAVEAAGLSSPRGIAAVDDSSFLVAEEGAHRVLLVGGDGAVTVVAGTGSPGLGSVGGQATDMALDMPTDVAVGSDGGFVVADTMNSRLVHVALDGSTRLVHAGDPFNFFPTGIDVDGAGRVFVAGGDVIRVDPDGSVHSIAVDGRATEVAVRGTTGIAVGGPFHGWGFISPFDPDGTDPHVPLPPIVDSTYGPWGQFGPSGSPVLGADLSDASSLRVVGAVPYLTRQDWGYIPADTTTAVLPGGVISLVDTILGIPRSAITVDETLLPESVRWAPDTVALGAGGTLLFVDSDDGERHSLHRVTRGGTTQITDALGLVGKPTSSPGQAVAEGPEGVYVLEPYGRGLLHVAADGVVDAMSLPSGSEGCGEGVGGPISQFAFCTPNAVDAGPDGSVYVADLSLGAVYRVGPTGIVTLEAQFDGHAELVGLGVASDGALYVYDAVTGRVFRRAGEEAPTEPGTPHVPSPDLTSPDPGRVGPPRVRLCASTTATTPFADVPQGSTHSAAIECLSSLRVIKGFVDGRFGGSMPVSRGQVASLFGRFTGVLDDDGPGAQPMMEAEQPVFRDVPASNVHAPWIGELAVARVILGDTDGLFHPDSESSRAQVASLLARLYEYMTGEPLAPGDDRFDDDDGSVHEVSINAMAAAGVIKGTDSGEYSPDADVTREQLASLLHRLGDKILADR